jgi:outer membrane protein assembly factor BamE
MMRYDRFIWMILQLPHMIEPETFAERKRRSTENVRARGARARAPGAVRPRTAPMAVALAAVLTGCVNRLPIRQGNYLDPGSIAQVKPGMTHSQVRYLLGTPMVPEGFDNGRWDYDYYLNEHQFRAKPRHAHVTVYFANDLVSRVQSDVQKAPQTAVTHNGIPVPNAF